MRLKDLLETSPETLAQRQEDALRKFAAERLRRIAGMIERGDYRSVREMLCGSPAGDEMGADNNYIDFSDTGLGDERNGADIGSVIDKLEQLEGVRSPKGKR